MERERTFITIMNEHHPIIHPQPLITKSTAILRKVKGDVVARSSGRERLDSGGDGVVAEAGGGSVTWDMECDGVVSG